MLHQLHLEGVSQLACLLFAAVFSLADGDTEAVRLALICRDENEIPALAGWPAWLKDNWPYGELRTFAALAGYRRHYVNLGGRQIDLVIAIDRAALVTESKGFTSAVRGGRNGDWEAHLASGVWKKFANPYLQAHGEKLALRDAMQSFAGGDVPYPNAALVFVPAVPPDSTIPQGDFKVSIGGLDELPAFIRSMKRDGWSLDQ